jgi:hypothetical protein
MEQQCFICLSQAPQLYPTCREGTCHNLNAHIHCLAKMPSQQCSICNQWFIVHETPLVTDETDETDETDKLCAYWGYVALGVFIVICVAVILATVILYCPL